MSALSLANYATSFLAPAELTYMALVPILVVYPDEVKVNLEELTAACRCSPHRSEADCARLVDDFATRRF
jgi:hypothetical protein